MVSNLSQSWTLCLRFVYRQSRNCGAIQRQQKLRSGIQPWREHVLGEKIHQYIKKFSKLYFKLFRNAKNQYFANFISGLWNLPKLKFSPLKIVARTVRSTRWTHPMQYLIWYHFTTWNQLIWLKLLMWNDICWQILFANFWRRKPSANFTFLLEQKHTTATNKPLTFMISFMKVKGMLYSTFLS